MSDKIQELVEQIKNESESGEHEKTREVLHVYLSELVKSFKQFELELPQALIEIAKAIKVELPEEQKVRVTNAKDIRTTLAPQSTVKLEPGSLTELSVALKAIKESLASLKSQELKLPTKAKDAIAVRLSDGEKFIEQLTQVITQGTVSGGGSVPKVTVSGGIQAVPVVNPDGSSIAGGSGSSAYSDSGDTDKKGLVDGDRHVQVDVLSVPTTAVTGTFWQATQPVSGTVTANLSATDNAVLDAIESDTTTLAGAVSGTEMQVDVVGALPAGTNALGKLLPPDIDVTTHTNYVKKYYTNAGAVTDGIVWSPASGKRFHIVTMHIQVSASCTVTLEDDKAGGDDPIFKAEYAANSGEFLVFPEHYPLASGEDTADLIVTTTAGNIYITITGYEI